MLAYNLPGVDGLKLSRKAYSGIFAGKVKRWNDPLIVQEYGDARKAAELHDLVRWCLTESQQYSADLGYAPLPSNIQQRSLAALDTMTASTH